VIEFARNVLGITGANSTEFEPGTDGPVISYMADQRADGVKGGTMRLGLYPCRLAPGSRAGIAYGTLVVQERHRHRLEFNNAFRAQFEAAGMAFSGQSPDGRLVEIAELPDHPWFVGSQFHPEFRSRPNAPHPLFQGFVEVCVAQPVAGEQARLPIDDASLGVPA
jgi:CTP synthase